MTGRFDMQKYQHFYCKYDSKNIPILEVKAPSCIKCFGAPINPVLLALLAQHFGLTFINGCSDEFLGVLQNERKVAEIRGIPLKRNFIEQLPYEHKLQQLANAKRKAGILAEVLFWQQVHKRKFYNIDFDRQRIIGNYIVDFFVKTLGLVVEIDGYSHAFNRAYDGERQRFLERLGLKVYRIADRDVKKGLLETMLALERYIIAEYGIFSTPACSHPSKGGEFCTGVLWRYVLRKWARGDVFVSGHGRGIGIPFPTNKSDFLDGA